MGAGQEGREVRGTANRLMTNTAVSSSAFFAWLVGKRTGAQSPRTASAWTLPPATLHSDQTNALAHLVAGYFVLGHQPSHGVSRPLSSTEWSQVVHLRFLTVRDR